MNIFTPNYKPTPTTHVYIIMGLVGIWLCAWMLVQSIIFPNPLEVIQAWPDLWSGGRFGQDLMASLLVNVESIGLSILISLPLAYLSRVPVVKPIATGLSKLRFLTPMAFFPIVSFSLHGGHLIKVVLLTLGESFYLLTTMVGVVQNIPAFKFDHARTLKMSEWQMTYYVVIRGTLKEALGAIRDNAAMGLAMLMTVEGAIRMDGGVGVTLSNAEKHLEFATAWLASFFLLGVGMTQDWILYAIGKVCCPYESNS